jgi:hypothetical protein
MMNFKLQAVLLALIVISLAACGNPPLAAPEKTNPEIDQAETVAQTDTENVQQQTEAAVVEPTPESTATLEIVGGSANSPLPSPTGSVAPTETVVSPTPLPSPVMVTPTEVIASSTPASPTATVMPETTETVEPPVQLTPTPSGGVSYSAEKINLVPVQLELEGLVTKDADSQINFGGWSNDNQKIYFGIPLTDFLIDSAAPNENNVYRVAELWIANIDGTNLQKISDNFGYSVVWSPDDSHLAYFEVIGVNKRELLIMDLSTGTKTKLVQPSNTHMNDTDFYDNIFWLNNDHLLYPTYSDNKRRYLWLHNIKTNEIQEVLVDIKVGDEWRSLNLAPNRMNIIGRSSDNLWLGKLIDDKGQYRLEYIKTLINNEIVVPFWSPDSIKLAIKSLVRFDNVLQILNINSNKIVEVTLPEEISAVEWSPDSNVILIGAFVKGTDTLNRIYVTNSDGSGLRLLP